MKHHSIDMRTNTQQLSYVHIEAMNIRTKAYEETACRVKTSTGFYQAFPT